MSTPFVVSLGIVVGLVLGSRVVFSALPSRRHGRPLTVPDALLFGMGLIGLSFHCGSMFFRSIVEALPGTASAINAINAFGPASKIGYAVPAALVVIGLRHQHPAAVSVVAAALTAVGITMYDGGPLSVHLTAIFIAVVVITVVLSMLVLLAPELRSGFGEPERWPEAGAGS